MDSLLRRRVYPSSPVPKALCIILKRSLEYPLDGTKYQSVQYLQMSPQKHIELREDLSFPFLMTPCAPSYSTVTCTLFLLPESSFLPQLHVPHTILLNSI